MPKQGYKQKPAGRPNPTPVKKVLGKRQMVANNMTVKPVCVADAVPYKGNAVLNANRG